MAKKLTQGQLNWLKTKNPKRRLPVGRPKKPIRKIVKKIVVSPDVPLAKKQAGGRPRGTTKAESGTRHREASQRYRQEGSASIRDIGGLPIDQINWDRRMSCKHDLKLFCKTYMPNVFKLSWSEDLKKCISRIEEIFINGGMFALAMPRGGGKTASSRGGMIWGTAYAYRHFAFFIGSSAEKATQTLDFIKMYWYVSPLLSQDFPEIAFPVKKLENRWHLAKGQTFNDKPTHIEWGSDSIQYPSLILPKEVSDVYLQHDPESVTWIESLQRYIPTSSGTIIRTSGIDGSIRGEAEVHPVLLSQPRPDVVLLDDIQKDQKADSPISCDKLINLVDGAVQGLAGPGEKIAALMPCTVIREGDASDTYLSQDKKPEWRGERCGLVSNWPDGITDLDITLDTPEGRHWNQYCELYRHSFRTHGDFRLATDYYSSHRKVMDKNFTCTWAERYIKSEELSAQQHAMNLRIKTPKTFAAEYQNKGRKDGTLATVLITAAQLADKTISLPHRWVPVDTQNLVAMIDVQNEVLFYQVYACSPDYTGVFPDYGTWPELPTRYFSKAQTESWSLLTRAFFERYPDQHDKAFKTQDNKVRAPLEAKIYHALGQAVAFIKGLRFTRDDGFETQMSVTKIGIDTRWGKVTDVIKRFCREYGDESSKRNPTQNFIVPYYGQGVSPIHKQYEEYTRTPGWLFEDQLSPEVKEVKWIFKPDLSGQYGLTVDVNRFKTFLFSRLSSPPGSPGTISLYKANPEHHELFSEHVCNSEYPEQVTAKGVTKEMWLEREGRPDNDHLDTSVGCLALASFQGAYLRTEKSPTDTSPRAARKLSQLWQQKRKGMNAPTADVA